MFRIIKGTGNDWKWLQFMSPSLRVSVSPHIKKVEICSCALCKHIFKIFGRWWQLLILISQMYVSAKIGKPCQIQPVWRNQMSHKDEFQYFTQTNFFLFIWKIAFKNSVLFADSVHNPVLINCCHNVRYNSLLWMCMLNRYR